MGQLATRRRFTFTSLWILLDATLAFVSLFLAYKVRYHADSLLTLELFRVSDISSEYVNLFLLAPLARLSSNFLAGHYRRKHGASGDFLGRIWLVTQGSTFLIVIAFFYRGISPPYDPFVLSRVVILFDWILHLFLVMSSYSLIQILYEECQRRGHFVQRIAIQGNGELAYRVADAVQQTPELQRGLQGYVSSVPAESDAMAAINLSCLGSLAGIRETINDRGLDTLILTDPDNLGTDLPALLEVCHELDVVVMLVPDLTKLAFQTSAIHELAGIPIFQVNDISITGFRQVLKRAEDLVISLIGILLAGPVMVVAAVCVKLDSPGPIFYVQKRVGRNGRHFNLFKLRSMTHNAESMREEMESQNESEGVLFKMKSDPRITRVGKIIRKTCIDELPQLFNVLRGEMSFVGPRPLPATDLTGEDAWNHARASVRPGITGMWQVNRVTHTPEEMFKWDIYYIENWSIWLDIRIMWKTVFVILTQRGSY